MESFENELYICLKDKEGNYLPFYNIKGTFSNNMKGGTNNSIIDNLTNIINFDQFNKNIKNKEQNSYLSETQEEDSINSEIQYEETGGENENNKYYEEEEKDEVNTTNSMLPQDFVDFFKKKINLE